VRREAFRLPAHKKILRERRAPAPKAGGVSTLLKRVVKDDALENTPPTCLESGSAEALATILQGRPECYHTLRKAQHHLKVNLGAEEGTSARCLSATPPCS